MEEQELKRYRLTIDDELFNTMNLISLVDDPAIEQNAMLFGKDGKPSENNYAFAKGIPDKQEITGPIMRANFDIVRYNYFTGEKYFVYFTEEDTKKIMQEFMRHSNNFATSFNHSFVLKNTYLTEIWSVVDPETDKSKALGFENVQVGDIYGTFKCDSTEIWNEIVKKYVKGFSIEGYFTEILDKFNKQVNMKNENTEIFVDDEDLTQEQVNILFNKVLSYNKKKLAKIREVNTYDITVDQDTVEVGTYLTTTWYDNETPIINKLNDGEYLLEDGSKIQVDSDGIVVMLTPKI